MGYRNIRFRHTDGTWGWQEHMPYDGILVTAAPAGVPDALLQQLAPGGRLVIPEGSRETQLLTVYTKEGEEIRREQGVSCVFVPLLGEHGWRK